MRRECQKNSHNFPLIPVSTLLPADAEGKAPRKDYPGLKVALRGKNMSAAH